MSLSMLIKATKNSSEMRDVATRICREYLSGAWKTISSEEIQVKRISGGLSNFLYYVSLPSKHELVVGSTASKRPRRDSYQTILEPTKVLLRIYGQTHGEHALETMLTESVVFTLLSERRLGPKLHGIFPGGRIEQYIPARALTTAELGKTEISLKIATKMSEIHSLDIPVSKDPDWLFNTINRWLNTVDTIMANIKNNNNDDEDARTHVLSKKLSKINFRYEAEWLKKVIENAQYPVLFCHNDLQEGNILFRQSSSMPSSDPMEQFETDLGPLLISSSSSQTERSSISKHDANGNSRKRSVAESSLNSDLIDLIDCNTTADDDGFSDQSAIADDEPELMIIDFEYCAYNYRAFDIANHFLEWTYDYTNDQFPFFYHRKEQYPTAQQMDSFLTTYLSRTIDDVTHLPILQEKKDLMEEIALFTLASHLFWGIWGIVNIHQDIEFGYWEYADVRLNEYFLAKEKYIDMNPNVRDIHDLGVRRK